MSWRTICIIFAVAFLVVAVSGCFIFAASDSRAADLQEQLSEANQEKMKITGVAMAQDQEIKRLHQQMAYFFDQLTTDAIEYRKELWRKDVSGE